MSIAIGSTFSLAGRQAPSLHRSHANACIAAPRTFGLGCFRFSINRGKALTSIKWSRSLQHAYVRRRCHVPDLSAWRIKRSGPRARDGEKTPSHDGVPRDCLPRWRNRAALFRLELIYDAVSSARFVNMRRSQRTPLDATCHRAQPLITLRGSA